MKLHSAAAVAVALLAGLQTVIAAAAPGPAPAAGPAAAAPAPAPAPASGGNGTDGTCDPKQKSSEQCASYCQEILNPTPEDIAGWLEDQPGVSEDALRVIYSCSASQGTAFCGDDSNCYCQPTDEKQGAAVIDCIIKNLHLKNGQTIQQAGGQQRDCCMIDSDYAACDILCGDGQTQCSFWNSDFGLPDQYGNMCSNSTVPCDPNKKDDCKGTCASIMDNTPEDLMEANPGVSLDLATYYLTCGPKNSDEFCGDNGDCKCEPLTEAQARAVGACTLDTLHAPDGKTIKEAGAVVTDCCVVDPNDGGGLCDIGCPNAEGGICPFWTQIGLDANFAQNCASDPGTKPQMLRRTNSLRNPFGAMWGPANLGF